MKYKLFIIAIFIFYHAKLLVGQETFYRSYDAQDGLPSSIIYDIISDEKGYLYLATDNGVYIYNGLIFKEIPISKTKATTFTDLNLDYKGVLWVRNFANEVFIKEKDSLKVVNNTLGISSDSFFINRLYYKDSSIYINNNIELYKYNIEYKTLKRLNSDNQNQDYKNNIWDVIIDDDNNYIVKTKNHFNVQQLNNASKTILFNNDYLDNIEGKFIPSNPILYVPFRQDSFSVYSWNGENFSNLFTIKNPGKSKIIRAFQFEENLVWCVTTAGLYLYNLQTKYLELMLPENIYVSKVIKGLDNSYWVSTIGNGLIHIPSTDIKIHLANKDKYNFISLAFLPNAEILAGTNRGQIIHLDRNSKKVQYYQTPYQDEIQFIYYDSLSQNIYHTFGSHKLGKQELDQDVNLSKIVVELDANHLLVGSWKGMFIVNKELDKPITYQPYIASIYNNKLLGSNRVRSIHVDQIRKFIYVVFIDNIVVFDINKGLSSTTILLDNNSIHATSLVASKDTLWIGTFSHGILAIDKNTNTIVQHFDKNNNLSSNNCKKLYLFENELWILTFKGLNKLSLKSKYITNLSNQYGLEHIFISDLLVDKDFVWLSSSNGILRINKSYFDIIKYPKLHLSQIKLKGEILPLKDTLYLPPSPKDLSISFESAIYNTNGDITYEYKFSASDTNWISLEKYQQTLLFPTLQPGSYELLLRINNPDKTYNNLHLKLFIVVDAHFWQRGYFSVLTFIFIVIFVMLFFYFFNKREMQKQRLRENLISYQLSAIRARMNPHFLYNILSSIQGLIYINRKEDAINVLGNFSQLMRIILDISNKESIALEDEIETLKLYTSLERVRFEEEDFVINFNIDERLDLENTFIPTLLIQPIVENAFKHGLLHKNGLKILDISFEKGVRFFVNHLIISVSDNGIGRAASNDINSKRTTNNKHTSFATKAIFQRIELINKFSPKKPVTIHYKDFFKDGYSSGTTVEILIPLEEIKNKEQIKNATIQQTV